MFETVRAYVEKLKREKALGRRIVCIICVLSLLVAGGVFWQLHTVGITKTDEADCGIAEHVHDESCAEKRLVCTLANEAPHVHDESCYEERTVWLCGMQEGEEETVHVHGDECYDAEGQLICTLSETQPHVHTDACGKTAEKVLICEKSDQPHIHTDECYEIIYTCGMEEHTHTAACYSDPDADVETPVDWEATLPDELSGEWGADLAQAAKSQIGYAESEANYKLDEQGVRRGYTRYGAWYGSSYGEWDAMFASFCLNYAKISDEYVPYNSGSYAFTAALEGKGLMRSAGEYTPTVGDLVFFDADGDGSPEHMGIVTQADGNTIVAVEGDVEDKVSELSYAPSDARIYAYADISAAQAESQASILSEAEESFGHIAGDVQYAYSEPSFGADSIDVKSFADTLGTQIKVQIIEKISNDEGKWYKVSAVTENSLLNNWISGHYPYIPYEEIVLDEEETSLSAIPESGAVVTVSGYLPEQASLHAQRRSYEEKLSAIDRLEELGGFTMGDFGFVYDIDLGVQPSAPVTVSVKGYDLGYYNYSNLNARVYHIHGEELEELEAELTQDGEVRFETSSFSDFYISFEIIEGREEVLGSIAEQARGGASYAPASGAAAYSLKGEAAAQAASITPVEADDEPSDVQVKREGGENSSEDGAVKVSKTIDGTDTENVFDITLKVSTTQNIEEFYEEPDMAVVIVMDISNTMNSNFGGISRYQAAMDSAEIFIKKFAQSSAGASRIGYVAFNTDAHQIFGLSDCSKDDQVTDLVGKMRTQTGNIINAAGYRDSRKRFTNIEAGLAMANDMLSSATNENKYIIFLSDGFPTTYISSGYTGYDTYDPWGTIFKDRVLNKPCSYGTSYSDEAAIRARNKAAAIKASGTKIFSIGVDVAGQTIQEYITQSENSNGFSVVDRTSTTYELGDASSTESFKNWLRSSIGSDYYYDSTNSAGLSDAYNKIFEEIKRLRQEGSEAVWVAQDPLPTTAGQSALDSVEFIGFYDKQGSLTEGALTGSNAENAENTASFAVDSKTISWDLKSSGYTTTQSGSTTTYTYTITYRVRLENEKDGFVERQIYDTNDTTTLKYQYIQNVNNNVTVSDPKDIEFPIPAVEGYLSELSFNKKDSRGDAVAGAQFTLTHDIEHCGYCRGDGQSSVDIKIFTAVSDAQGKVSFTRIPSGHTYTLEETGTPVGYLKGTDTYSVKVAFDVVTVTVTHADGTTEAWDMSGENEIINFTSYELPKTGGGGAWPFVVAGMAMMCSAAALAASRRRKKREH